jgi:hypothetical protein
VRSLLDWTLPRISPVAAAADDAAAPATLAAPNLPPAPVVAMAPEAPRTEVPGSDPEGLATPLPDTSAMDTPVFDEQERETRSCLDEPSGDGAESDDDDPDAVAASAAVPEPRGDRADAGRPSPVARSGQRAGARR